MDTPPTLTPEKPPVANSLNFYQMVKTVLEKGECWTPDSPKNFIGSPQSVVKAVRLELSNGILKIIEYTDHTVSIQFEGRAVNESMLFNWGRSHLGDEVDELHRVIAQAVELLTEQ